jgi:hypothetical protein
MLTPFDDLALHQLPTTFDHVVSSDPRWFEHMYFLMTARDGSVAVVSGARVYMNVDVVETFAAVLYEGKQYNVRASRRLRPDLEKAAGPVRVRCLEGLRRFQLTLGESQIPVAFDLEWLASGPAWEEPHHFKRVQGRIAEDYMRFDQVGSFAGSIRVGDKRFELAHADTFAARDHSWGVRTMIGGDMHGARGFDGGAHWVLFDIEGAGQGYYAQAEDTEGRPLRTEGRWGGRFNDERPADEVVGVDHRLTFQSGSRRIRDGEITLRLADGRTVDLQIEALSEPLNEHGCGNQKGFADGLGYGVDRGALLVEGDIWDQSAPDKVVNLGPSETVPNDRLFDNIVRLRCGDRTGYAIYVFFAKGAYAPYGFKA